VGAFLRAGADAVIVSEGDLAWTTTLERSKRLHAALAAGATPAEALRRIRLDEIRRGGIDPAHRSMLVVHGLAHRPVLPAASSSAPARVAALAGGIVAALAAGLVARSRRRRAAS
jgi:hypothetical protein